MEYVEQGAVRCLYVGGGLVGTDGIVEPGQGEEALEGGVDVAGVVSRGVVESGRRAGCGRCGVWRGGRCPPACARV